MRNLDWDRTARITEIRDRIWSYVSPASRFEVPDLLVAGALLQWPENEAARLGELQFLLCSEVGDFLMDLPQLMRRLITSSAREEEQTTQSLRGPVEWAQTLALRNTTGSPNVYVTTPARRVYQTPENELLVHVLDAIVHAAQHSGWDKIVPRQEPALRVRDRLAEASRWQRTRMLSDIDRVAPTPRAIARIRTGRNAQRYAFALAAHDKLRSLVEQLDRRAIQEAIEDAGLVTAEEPILFELLATFHVVDALNAGGWHMTAFTLFGGHTRTAGHRTDGRQIDLWYQCTPQDLTQRSQYTDVLKAHGFPRAQGLRPDIILRWDDQGGKQRWLLIECKLTASGVAQAARRALADLLTYRSDFDAILGDSEGPHGLGIAWGEGLQPVEESRGIVLCTPDMLPQTIQQIVI